MQLIHMRLAVRMVILVLALATCRSAEAQTTALYFDSEPGDYIGQGLERTWTGADLTFRVTSASSSNISIQADNFPSGSTSWSLNFAEPASGGEAVVEPFRDHGQVDVQRMFL